MFSGLFRWNLRAFGALFGAPLKSGRQGADEERGGEQEEPFVWRI